MWFSKNSDINTAFFFIKIDSKLKTPLMSLIKRSTNQTKPSTIRKICRYGDLILDPGQFQTE